MTEEEKRLLLVDLCGRIPYGVKVNINSPIEEQNRMELFDVNLDSGTIGVGNEKWMFRAVPVENEDGWIVKPYLRRMESMTDEEEIYYNTVYTTLKFYEKEDWLNAHHFDYRVDPITGKGMIDMGLAEEAPEWMYNKEEGSLE